jgi:hypothetical protein
MVMMTVDSSMTKQQLVDIAYPLRLVSSDYARNVKTNKSELIKMINSKNKIQHKGNTMKNTLQNISKQTVQANKDALIVAAKIEVGKTVNAQLKKLIKPQLPMMIRGYADSPIFDIIIANVASIALKELAAENKKAQVVADSLLQAATVEMMNSFNINKMIDDILKNIDIKQITNIVDTK